MNLTSLLMAIENAGQGRLPGHDAGRIARCIGNRERPADQPSAVEPLPMDKGMHPGVLEQRVPPQFFSCTVTSQLHRVRVRRRPDHCPIVGGAEVGFVAFIPHKEHPSRRNENAMKLCERG
jgi:hypothetical protein